MCECKTKKKSGIYTASVVYNRPVGERFFRLSMKLSGQGAAAFTGARAGQFLELQVENLSIPACTPQHLKDAAIRNPILRRPLSFVDITNNGDSVTVDVMYCVIGAGTVRLTSLVAGDLISLIGPLGNGFTADAGCKTAVMVAGGIGCPPIEHFTKELAAARGDIKIAAFTGARTVKDLPFLSVQQTLACGGQPAGIEEFTKHRAQSVIATDDGSAGFKGVVTAAVDKWLDENNTDAAGCTIFACGPEPMLRAVSVLAAARDIKCMVSLERMMACGIGVCQSCAVETRVEGKEETVYKLCCKDGPVFDSREVVW